MANKNKHDFMCRLIERWRSITCLSEMTQVLKTLVKNLCSYFLSLLKYDQNCPNKMIACSIGRFLNFIQGLKMASFM